VACRRCPHMPQRAAWYVLVMHEQKTALMAGHAGAVHGVAWVNESIVSVSQVCRSLAPFFLPSHLHPHPHLHDVPHPHTRMERLAFGRPQPLPLSPSLVGLLSPLSFISSLCLAHSSPAHCSSLRGLDAVGCCLSRWCVYVMFALCVGRCCLCVSVCVFLLVHVKTDLD
jgi:hypothetical protein